MLGPDCNSSVKSAVLYKSVSRLLLSFVNYYCADIKITTATVKNRIQKKACSCAMSLLY